MVLPLKARSSIGFFNRAVELASEYPLLGRKSEFENIRIKVIRDYLLVYEIANDDLLVLMIWDSRQSADDLVRLLGKRK